MTDYVDSALFVYTESTEFLAENLQNNLFGTRVIAIAFDSFIENPKVTLENISHVIVAGALSKIKVILSLAIEYDFSVGLIPTKNQKDLINSLDLPEERDSAIELALRRGSQAMDLTLCNGKILLFKATFGRLPLLDVTSDANRFTLLARSLRKSFTLKLLKFQFTTAKGQKIKTAASGCMIVQRHRGSLAARIIENDSSVRDGVISMVVSSPFSIIAYFTILLRLMLGSANYSRLPIGIGYIKSSKITIESETQLNVEIDGEVVTQTPLLCETIPEAIHINVGQWLAQDNKNAIIAKESVRTSNLPNEKELEKLSLKNIPFFSSASEERFRDLFISLRDDARTNSIYITLMVLSTMLATIGLYQSSSAVVIGAMLLSPLMAPIVSLAMGLLRNDRPLLKNSSRKIMVGILLALLGSILITQFFPHKPITAEMEARLSPTLLDLAVAIISGIAGAYSKSYKEILQSLAGVAVAVALVPPLAVAGIGIGRGDFDFFLQAFLLFSTNLVGIILAATLTFRVLGYSSLTSARRGITAVVLMLAIIIVPLYASYDQIVEAMVFEKTLKQDRFLVNGKYIIVKDVQLSRRHDKEIILMDVLTRGALNRKDLLELKRKIQLHFDRDLKIRTRVFYIL